MERLRLLLLTGTFDPERCGVSHYTSILRERLREHGIASAVLTTFEAAARSDDESVCGAVEGWGPACLSPLVRTIREAQPDLLHIQFAQGSYRFRRSLFLLPPLLRAARFRRPIITTLHEFGSWEWRPPLLPAPLFDWVKRHGEQRRWWERESGFLLTMSDRIIATQPRTEELLRERVPHLLPRVRAIPLAPNIEVTGVDSEGARRSLRKEFGWPDDAEVLLFFGFLHPVKGIEYLLRAFSRLRRTRPRARLLIAGGQHSLALSAGDADDYFASLQSLAAGLDLLQAVRFTGFVADQQASAMLLGSDIGVLPFNHGVDLKSGSLLAMLAHGLPTIATRAQAPVPSLDDGEIVVRVERRDADGLHGALVALLEDGEWRSRLARRGRAFSQSFTWQAIARDHLSLYNEFAG